jgi:hypothetical protein
MIDRSTAERVAMFVVVMVGGPGRSEREREVPM